MGAKQKMGNEVTDRTRAVPNFSCIFPFTVSFHVSPLFVFVTPGKKGSMEILVLFFGVITYSPGSRGEMLNGIPGGPIDFGKMSTHICSFPCE